MIWTVDQAKVAAEISRLPRTALRYWDACLAEIAVNPRSRHGSFVERVDSIRRSSLKTYLFEITEETSFSGERMHVLVAEFFPFYIPVYVIDEAARRVTIIYLRENHLV